ncbi:FecR domain-containing protein [Bacteroides sp. BFG-638]|uniref:FecR family protein n=1 Tax=Bacteroides sp. BFG-638 TaxID=2972765 RepID=UPI0021661B76|nr:FecR domain-containing protein [Bacteroides sp. BFG-638]MCS2948079.1 FecR domain-containing protein [Bacteroides sp. BFG-638]
MDEKNININKSEEEALKIMENVSHITSDQLHGLEKDEECFQACVDIAEVVMEMRQKQNTLAINVQKELVDFHNKRLNNNKKKNTRILWTAIAGVAATVIVILILRTMMISPEPKLESIKIFEANHAIAQATLQIDDEKEIRPLKDQKIDYHRTIQTENKEVGKQKVQIHRLSIPGGETFKVVLSEGTEVFLNSDSRLVYPTVFKGKERIVSLEGEAYFKVSKDVEHPFIVKTGNVQVRVLGTEFNVRGYSPADVRITLITGKVAVSDTCGTHNVEMEPGQSAQLSTDGTFAVSEVNIESFLYWKEGFFYFDDIPLADMMKEIGRWYNIDIEFRNSKIMDLRMHFFANRHQDIFNLIELLNRMERVHAYFETGKLIIE